MKQFSQVQVERPDKNSASSLPRKERSKSQPGLTESTCLWSWPEAATWQGGKVTPGVSRGWLRGRWSLLLHRSVCSQVVPTSSPWLPFFPCPFQSPFRNHNKQWIFFSLPNTLASASNASCHVIFTAALRVATVIPTLQKTKLSEFQ